MNGTVFVLCTRCGNPTRRSTSVGDRGMVCNGWDGEICSGDLVILNVDHDAIEAVRCVAGWETAREALMPAIKARRRS